ncbi:hypothetical protein CRE_29034 [Caenorhabditis remanei]|uniref:Uncharacterized protein n=1 Tax=Caenorhabditis remanei TaxID=31234 RepID=E3NA39_CAERE|nr:hypothetical protein CRE_29034 [Caenorhabditis remanei]
MKAEVMGFAEFTGKSTSTILNAKYEGTGDYLIITADFTTQTEKTVTSNGKLVQIWKKDGDRHLIYHDEWEVVV